MGAKKEDDNMLEASRRSLRRKWKLEWISKSEKDFYEWML